MQPKTHFQQLDAEPRPVGNPSAIFPGGPPPSYRSSTNADDSVTFSSTESSSVAVPISTIKRRNSWANLIESNENLCKKHLLHNTQPPYTTTTAAANRVNSATPACFTATGSIYENSCKYLEKYNLAGRYAKHFTPFYVLNSAGDPIAISKLQLTNCDGSLRKLNGAKKASTGYLKRNRMSELRQLFREARNKSYAFILLLSIITCCIIATILLLNSEFTKLPSCTDCFCKAFATSECIRLTLAGKLMMKSETEANQNATLTTRTAENQEARKFSWIPPVVFRNEKGNSTLVRMYQNGHQVRFEILGNLPIKNNYIAVYDFTVRTEQIHGWEEAWNFLPGSYFGNTSTLFHPSIPECDGARWILLNYTASDQRGSVCKLSDSDLGMKCSDCYDFCLPELGVERDHLRGETLLNIIRRSCFYLFVPEWRSFAAAYSGRQNEYDFQQFHYRSRNRINSDNGNRNSGSGSSSNNDGNYENRLNGIQNIVDGIIRPITDRYRNFESKWISLQEIPQKISSSVVSQVNNTASVQNMQNSPPNVVQSFPGIRNYQQQSIIENSFTGMPPPNYPIQAKQHSPSSLDHKTSFPDVLQPYQNFGSGNMRQQNNAFGNSNSVAQFAVATKFSEQPTGYNSQLPISLSNAVSIDGKDNQPKNVYDQSIVDAASISRQPNYYTSQPGIDVVYMQQVGKDKQNDQDNSPRSQQAINDQGWITVG
ncbi:unnamed protein product [Litomosoides sigmodontis]|uniref:Uncharacterized protein n=1 Tax=Litomosoides sigmodontis TaxID=42156 RepID=A0A3P6TXG7_LITSI|nr:unnamed protein product [Litomosoides sigmodontis]